METKDRCRLEFTRSSAKITKTTIVEAVKVIQNYPTLYTLKKSAREIIDYVYNNISFSREDKDGIKVARAILRNPNPEFNKRTYNFLVEEDSAGVQRYCDYPSLVELVENLIVYIPEFVEDNRERIDLFI